MPAKINATREMGIEEVEFRDEHRDELNKYKYWPFADVRKIYENPPKHIDPKEWNVILYVMEGVY